MLELSNSSNHSSILDIAALMQRALKNPITPVVSNLLNQGEIGGLHGPQEAFKTIFTLQLAESIASGTSFLGLFPVPKARPVFYYETEMSHESLGNRLISMFQKRVPPRGVLFPDEENMKQFRCAANLSAKFAVVREGLEQAESDVLMLDTCNPFFRGKQSPNDETTVGEFFDHLEGLPAAAKVFVRHNHKPRVEDLNEEGAARIRGSGQFADVPDLLIELRRADKRTNKAVLTVTKYRHGTKPDDLTLWFDTSDFRLISLPPVIHVLRNGPLSRQDVLAQLEQRFGIGERLGADHIDEQLRYLDRQQEGHKLVYELNLTAAEHAAWYEAVTPEGVIP